MSEPTPEQAAEAKRIREHYAAEHAAVKKTREDERKRIEKRDGKPKR